MKKILFIANIGSRRSDPNGVSIKNQHVLKYLKQKKDARVVTIDTDHWKFRIVQLFIQIFFSSFCNEKIILSIDSNSAYQLLKFFSLFGLDKKIIYFVAGGRLQDQINAGTFQTKYFRNIRMIFVQTDIMEKELRKKGLTNVQKLPNAKYFQDLTLHYDRIMKTPIKSFYLGRVHPDKGIDLIFESLKAVNGREFKYTIDFYGPIEKSYQDEFFKKIKECDFANYKGVIDLLGKTENYYLLSEYDLFIFPTYWRGEGFPGVVIDSFISGVPVLASDWNHNREVIQDGFNGIIFESKNVADLVSKLEYIGSNPEALIDLRKNAHESAKYYKTQNVLKVLDQLVWND